MHGANELSAERTSDLEFGPIWADQQRFDPVDGSNVRQQMIRRTGDTRGE
jgi:hypothetical protein